MKTDYMRLRREQELCAICGDPSVNYRCEQCRAIRRIKQRDYKDRKTGTTQEERIARGRAIMNRPRVAAE